MVDNQCILDNLIELDYTMNLLPRNGGRLGSPRWVCWMAKLSVFHATSVKRSTSRSFFWHLACICAVTTILRRTKSCLDTQSPPSPPSYLHSERTWIVQSGRLSSMIHQLTLHNLQCDHSATSIVESSQSTLNSESSQLHQFDNFHRKHFFTWQRWFLYVVQWTRTAINSHPHTCP